MSYKKQHRTLFLDFDCKMITIKSCAVIGYPSGQDEAILPARDYRPSLARKISPNAI